MQTKRRTLASDEKRGPAASIPMPDPPDPVLYGRRGSGHLAEELGEELDVSIDVRLVVGD